MIVTNSLSKEEQHLVDKVATSHSSVKKMSYLEEYEQSKKMEKYGSSYIAGDSGKYTDMVEEDLNLRIKNNKQSALSQSAGSIVDEIGDVRSDLDSIEEDIVEADSVRSASARGSHKGSASR